MVDGINDYLVRQSAAAPAGRARYWHRDFSSAEAYSRSVEPNREHLARIIGAVDPPLQVKALDFESSTAAGSVGRPRPWVSHPGRALARMGGRVCRGSAARTRSSTRCSRRCPARCGLESRGAGRSRARYSRCRAVRPAPGRERLPGAGARGAQSPGHMVGNPLGSKMTNQPHREWIYRMAFEVGRHVIGYEVQKVRAAVGWFAAENAGHCRTHRRRGIRRGRIAGSLQRCPGHAHRRHTGQRLFSAAGTDVEGADLSRRLGPAARVRRRRHRRV